MNIGYIDIASECPLFAGIEKSKTESLLNRLNASERKYKQGEALILQGEKIRYFGIILSGSVTAVRYSSDGSSDIRSRLLSKSVFGEILSSPSAPPSPVNVTANEDLSVLWIRNEMLFQPSILKTYEGVTLIRNFTNLMSGQYFTLERKVRYLTIPSLRARITEYLRDEAGTSSPDEYFTIPFSREILADYLGVNRSALSRELSRMRAEKLIDYNKNKFRMLK